MFWQSTFGPLTLATRNPSCLMEPLTVAVRPRPPTSRAFIWKVLDCVFTLPLACAICFMSFQAIMPSSELLGPTTTC